MLYSLTVKTQTSSAHKNNFHKRATGAAYNNRSNRNYQIETTQFSTKVEIDHRVHWLMIRIFSKLGKPRILAPSDYFIESTMPKKKNVSSSSDSDSGPDDVSIYNFLHLNFFQCDKYISKSCNIIVSDNLLMHLAYTGEKSQNRVNIIRSKDQRWHRFWVGC